VTSDRHVRRISCLTSETGEFLHGRMGIRHAEAPTGVLAATSTPVVRLAAGRVEVGRVGGSCMPDESAAFPEIVAVVCRQETSSRSRSVSWMTGVPRSQSLSPRREKTRRASALASVFFFVFWILWGVDLFGRPEFAFVPWRLVSLVPFALFVGCSMYGWRKRKELALIINHRFAQKFTVHTRDTYPKGVDILRVQRSLAVLRDDGSVFVWGVERKRTASTSSHELRPVQPIPVPGPLRSSTAEVEWKRAGVGIAIISIAPD
jgi:hypothetical protein